MVGTEVLAFILIISLGLIYVLFLYAIVRARKKDALGWAAVTVAALIGLLLITYLFANITKIVPADWAQIILTLGLVAVTGMYAWSTQKQAAASVKMAEEMREQRYDTIRPVLDIVNISQLPAELARQAYANDLSRGVSCKLCNIGVGPAIGTYSFICHPSGESRRFNFGTIAIGNETSHYNLSLTQKDARWFFVAYYKDVYGRWFESSRELKVGAVNPDPLQIREISEKELPND